VEGIGGVKAPGGFYFTGEHGGLLWPDKTIQQFNEPEFLGSSQYGVDSWDGSDLLRLELGVASDDGHIGIR
jgi:hypothetical protein